MMLQPVQLQSSSGQLFGIYYPAALATIARGAALFVPPFSEEMNRSRRMATLQAQAFAASGISTLLFDPFGTGDSEGDFRDARIARWLDDIAAASAWLAVQAKADVWLWGLRLGALLACAAAAKEPGRFRRLLLWQPVSDGKTMLTQFLRTRVAASMAEGGPAEKTEGLRARLAGGESIEVAGYEVSPDLAHALDEMRLDRLAIDAGTRVDWLEVAPSPDIRLLPAGQRIVENWRMAGIAVSAAAVAGDPFWTLQETTLAPELLMATTRLVQL